MGLSSQTHSICMPCPIAPASFFTPLRVLGLLTSMGLFIRRCYMEMHYIGPLLGRSALITFHEFVTECSYSINGQLNWRVIDINGNVTEGCEQVSYLQLS